MSRLLSRALPSFLARLSTAAAAGLLSLGSHAQSTGPARTGWEFSAGPALFSVPKYLGSDERRTLLIPFVEAKGPNGLFASVERGFGQELKLGESTRVAYSLALDLNTRRRKDDVRFAALEDIKEAPALRLEGEESLGRFTVSATAQARLGRASQSGLVISLEGAYELTQARDFLLSVGLNTRLMNARFARNFFGVSPAQAAASGLRAYEPAGGLYSVAPFVQALARIDDDWTLFARAEAGRLRGDAGRSPLVRQARGEVLVISASRAF